MVSLKISLSVVGFVLPNFTVATANVAASKAGVVHVDIHGARKTIGTSPVVGDNDFRLRLLARRRHCRIAER
jgi:hypothetical protein